MHSLRVEQLSEVLPERHVGFLHLLDHLVRALGHRLDGWLRVLVPVVLLVLAKYSAAARVDAVEAADSVDEDLAIEDAGEEEGEARPEKGRAVRNKARTLCIAQLEVLVDLYGGVFDFT